MLTNILFLLAGVATNEYLHYRIRRSEAAAFMRGRTASRRMTDAHVSTPIHAEDLGLITPEEYLTLQSTGSIKKVRKAG